MISIPTKKLPRGTEIPVIGLGTWEQVEHCAEVVKKALAIGYRLIDTAQVYGNHLMVKEGIKGFPRKDLFIASKLQWDFLEPELVEPNCDKTISELGCDYLDLFMIHWPNNKKQLSKIIEKLFELKAKGKIRNVGVCNFTQHHLQDLLDDGFVVDVLQVEFHPYLYQKTLHDFCIKNEIAITAYSPLAHGQILQNEVIKKIGAKYNKSVSQVILRWLLDQDILVIPKGSSEKHLKENLEVFDFNLTEEDHALISSLNKDRRVISPPIQEFDY